MVLALLLWWLLRSPWGRAFAALRDNPIRAESLGVNITAYTLLAFAIGAACAGVGGVYFASLVEFIEPGPFHFSTSLTMLLAVIVGGSGRFFGPVVGTVDHRAAAGVAARVERAVAQVHADLVPRGVRRRRGRADGLAAGRPAVDPRALQAEGAAPSERAPVVPRSQGRRASTTARSGPSTASRCRSGPGEIVGVIGPNGSGKTTLFNSILGQIRPTAGQVEFCGEDITGMSPLELSRRGVGRTFQTLQVFGKLSVRDNLIVAAQEFKGTLPARLFARARRGPRAPRRRDDRALPPAARRAPAGGHAVLRPAEADRHRDGVHAGAAAGAARRALRGRQPEPRRPAARAAARAQPDAGRQLRRHRAQHGLHHEAVPARDLHGRGQGAGRGPAEGRPGEPAGARGISWQLSLGNRERTP